MPRLIRLATAAAATALVVGPVVWLWQDSMLPDAYSIVDMGYTDTGGAPASEHDMHATEGRSVTALTADPRQPADVAVTLTAQKQTFSLASGREVDGCTLNGQSPGPTIRATAGQLVQVRLVNQSVPDGVTLHRHGVDVPDAMDGVAGVTQDAVGVGEEFSYLFVTDQVGTSWYHSHQISHEPVRGGLHGHHAVFLCRNGVPATGSSWWVDSPNVGDDESYEIAFVADHPGIWMDHCHNLTHAQEGLVAHLMYEGVTTPFVIGGTERNEPE